MGWGGRQGKEWNEIRRGCKRDKIRRNGKGWDGIGWRGKGREDNGRDGMPCIL